MRACSAFFPVASFLKSSSGVIFALTLFLKGRGACAFLNMTLELSHAQVRAGLYLLLDGGALLFILAGFFCIGAGGRFGRLFVLILDSFCSILLDVHEQVAWTLVSQSVVCWSSSNALG